MERGGSRGARAFTHILTQLSNFLDLKEDINAPWSLLSGNSQFRRIDEELTQSSYARNITPSYLRPTAATAKNLGYFFRRHEKNDPAFFIRENTGSRYPPLTFKSLEIIRAVSR